MASLLRTTLITPYSSQVGRAGRRLFLSKGWGRSGNSSGPLHDLPDWSFADGRPAPVHPRMAKKKAKQEREQYYVAKLARSIDKKANSGHLPSTPGISRHRRNDVDFYWREQNASEELPMDEVKRLLKKYPLRKGTESK